jgi:hypothetical protein
VSGTGFSLDAEITDLCENVLRADGTACGVASIIVVGCDGTTVHGMVKCPIGVWRLCGEGHRELGQENEMCLASVTGGITTFYSNNGIFKAQSDGSNAWVCRKGNTNDFVAECDIAGLTKIVSLRQVASEYLNSGAVLMTAGAYKGTLEENLIRCEIQLGVPCLFSLGQPYPTMVSKIWHWGC